MFHHATADRILTVIGAWIVLASLGALLIARCMGRRRDAQISRKFLADYETHVAEALDLLEEKPLMDKIAEEQAVVLVSEIEAFLGSES